MSRKKQPNDIEDTIGMSKKTEKNYFKGFLKQQINAALDGTSFTDINKDIEKEIIRASSPGLDSPDVSEYVGNALFDLDAYRLIRSSLFENVEVRSAREMEMVLRLMRSNSLYHLREVFTEEENNSLDARNFYQDTGFNFKHMPNGFDRSISKDGKTKNFALFKEDNTVFALTPNEVYCILDGKFKIGYRTGVQGISGIFDQEYDYIPFNNVTVEEGKSFITPTNSLLDHRRSVSNNSPIVSDSFASSYLILASEADLYSKDNERDSLSNLERLLAEDPSIEPLVSDLVKPIIELHYTKGMSSNRIKSQLERGQTRLGEGINYSKD